MPPLYLALAVIGYFLWKKQQEPAAEKPIGGNTITSWWLQPSSPTPLPIEEWQREFIAEFDKPGTTIFHLESELRKAHADAAGVQGFISKLKTQNTVAQNTQWFFWALEQMIWDRTRKAA
jgi:hypothetical protein